MIRYFLAALLGLHGLIHFMGFTKAFHLAQIDRLAREISKPAGALWLLTGLLLVAAAVLLLFKKEWWPFALVAAILSQALIFTVWSDAKFGSIANAILLLAALLAFGARRFERTFQEDARHALKRSDSIQTPLVTESDLQHLPAPVGKYLRYAGVIGKPRVLNMKITFEGEMRDRGKAYFPFRSVQYNCFDQPTRLFFMKARMFGVTVPGYHAYQNGVATMQVKLFGLLPVVDLEGDILNKAETVTVFNDMCLMAPATLIDRNIRWETIDSLSAKAVFTCNGISIGATLFFNEAGQLTNFVSDDRYAVADMKQYRFSTPVRDYQTIHGYQVMTYGEAVWHYPEGAFTYGKFRLRDVEYNVGWEG